MLSYHCLSFYSWALDVLLAHVYYIYFSENGYKKFFSPLGYLFGNQEF